MGKEIRIDLLPEDKMVTLNCMVCGNEFEGPEPQMCCSGRECGCMGMPVDPVVCSKECYDNLPFNKIKMKPQFNFIIEHTIEEGQNVLNFIPAKDSEGYKSKKMPITQEQWDSLQYSFMKAIDDANQITRLSYIS